MSISADERQWRAEEDARVLAEAQRIAQDKDRLNKAAEAAKRMAEEEAERVKAMRNVARRGGKDVSTSTEPKRPHGQIPFAVPSTPIPSKTDSQGIATFTLNRINKK
jgi:hypothetical protein